MSSDQDHLKETDTEERFEFKKEQRAAVKSDKGLTEEVVRLISEDKDEPEWMLQRRLRALEHYQNMPMPTDWPGQPDLSGLDVEEIVPYIRPDVDKRGGADDWDDLPDDIKDTFDKLGIPEAERNALSGVGAQYESEVVYQNMQEQWEEKGVVFCNMDQAVQEHEDLVKEYFMTKCVPPSDNKFAALHGAVWSGGSFVYVPEDVTVQMPVQAYFRMNSEGMGQFEHTLIIAEEGSEVHYIEGCSAPKYSAFNLHSGGVEVFVGEDAHVQYSTVQNWSKNTYNLNTKRAIVEAGGRWSGSPEAWGRNPPCSTRVPSSRVAARPRTRSPSPSRARDRTSTPARRSTTTRRTPTRPSSRSPSARTAAARTTAASSTSAKVRWTRPRRSSVTR